MQEEVKEQIIEGITSYFTPERLALLLGITEIELKSIIINDEKFLKKIRNLIFNLQRNLQERILSLLDKKQPNDFMQDVAQQHFDTWSRFVATDISNSTNFLFYTSAIKGGIGNVDNFWRGVTNDIKNSFKMALKTNENFTRLFFDIIEGKSFEMGIHHKAMFDELELVEKGITNILIVNIPPRLGKSSIGYCWATKTIMQKQGSNIIYGSYGDIVLTLIRKRIDNAFDKSDMINNKINPFYEIYGVTKEKGFAKESDFVTNINSMFFSATMLGGVTGRGHSVYSKANGAMILDDPNNPNDAGTLRMETIAEKFDTTWYPSRAGLNPLVVFMQRVADNDLTAHILNRFRESSLNIRVLTLPLEMTEEVEEYIAKQQSAYPNIHFVSPLKYMEIGESLLPYKSVELLKQSAHPSIYKTQYLQIPTSLEGTIFKSRMFYNKVISFQPVIRDNYPNGYVEVSGIKRQLSDESWLEHTISYEGVLLLHIDTTSGNTDTITKDVDDCVWSVCVAGLKERKQTDNYFGAILHQHAINSKFASELVMQKTTLEIIKQMQDIYNQNIEALYKRKPFIIIAIESHSQGGGLASYLKGLKLENVYVIVYSRQNSGDKKVRFIQGAGYYSDRIFWYQNDLNIIKLQDENGNDLIANNWYGISRMQHLSLDGENAKLHDDYVEAPIDICNLWLASNGKDKLYSDFLKAKGIK